MVGGVGFWGVGGWGWGVWWRVEGKKGQVKHDRNTASVRGGGHNRATKNYPDKRKVPNAEKKKTHAIKRPGRRRASASAVQHENRPPEHGTKAFPKLEVLPLVFES